MATIEGKPAAQWFKEAAQRQKRSNAFASYEAPAAKPEPARQVAAMPKAQDHASPAKTAAKPSAPAPKPAAPAPRAKTASEEGQERIAAAKKMISEHMATSRPDSERQKEIADWKAKADAKQEAENKAAREAQHRRDVAAATPGPVKMAKGAGILASRAGGGLASAARAARRYVGKQYSDLGKYAASEAEKGKKFYAGVGKWITGDPEAKKRLAAGAK